MDCIEEEEEEEEEMEYENQETLTVDDSFNFSQNQSFRRYAEWSTNEYKKSLQTNSSIEPISFEEYIDPFLISHPKFVDKYKLIPQKAIIKLNRWSNHGLCVSLSYISDTNLNIIEFVWNPPMDDVLKVLTQRVNYNPRDNIYICNKPTNGYLYDTGTTPIIDWMKLIKPLGKSYRIMVSYKTHASPDELVSKSLQPISYEDNTALSNLFQLSEPAEIAARNWFSRAQSGLESLYLDCGKVMLPNLFTEIVFCSKNRIFAKYEKPIYNKIRASDNNLDQISILPNSVFVHYFLFQKINTVPKYNRLIASKLTQKRNTNYITQNDLDIIRGKMYKQRGYMHYNISPSIDGEFYPSRQPEEIIRLPL